ncbi:hypothetical protein [Streptomyces griseoaurantiacus]|uniref:hypothetical protein n=1 Tax=Streptomyces griseoaurantiacus TaxID=68213 RepID=UPI0036A51DE2
MSKYTDDLSDALNVVNPVMISRRYQCPVIIFKTQHPHAFGSRGHRAEVYFHFDGKPRRSKPIRVRDASSRITESREAHLQAAIAWSKERGMKVEEWVPTGFANSWMPRDVKDRMVAELKAWRKEQRASRTEKES